MPKFACVKVKDTRKPAVRNAVTEARRDKQIKGGRNATKFLSRAAGEPGAGFSLPKGKFLPLKTCVKYGHINDIGFLRFTGRF